MLDADDIRQSVAVSLRGPDGSGSAGGQLPPKYHLTLWGYLIVRSDQVDLRCGTESIKIFLIL